MTMIDADIMTSPVYTVSPSTRAGEILQLLARQGISAVPVVGEGGVLEGIVSEQDVIAPFRQSLRSRRDWWLSLLAEGEALSQEFLGYIAADQRSAAELMTKDVAVADERAGIAELAELMLSRKVKRVPILRDGRLAGIVSRADLVRALARKPSLVA